MHSKLQPVPRRTSLAAQTASILRDELKSGRWLQWLPGEHELCALLHVSRVTVRAALRRLEQEGWLRARQGRRREIAAPVARRRRAAANTRVILLTADPLLSLPAFVVFWVDRLREQLSNAGFHLEVHVSRSFYGSRSSHALKALTDTTHPAVWILYRSTFEMQRWFSVNTLPCVITGSRHPGIELPSLDTDYRATCRHAAGQFLARGHRRMLLLNPASGTRGELESEEGFQEAAARTAASAVDAAIVRHDGTVAGICARLDACLRRPERATALLVSRPVHVLTVLGHLMRRGIRLPEDIALISRDDDSFLEHVLPSVARYSSSPTAFAQKLSKIVLEVAAGGVLSAADHRIMPRFLRGETFR